MSNRNSSLRFAIVVSQFNEEVTGGLKAGALALLSENGIPSANIEIISAPGAFEIPLIAQTLAKTKKYDGVICLGCVIKGDTAHFEFISLGATIGIQIASLSTEVPIAFGILTTYTDEQAAVRSKKEGAQAPHNKGREAALACLSTVNTIKTIRS